MSNLEIHNGSFKEKVVAGKPSKKYLRIPSALEKLKKLQIFAHTLGVASIFKFYAICLK